jgi:hypothetical protein
MGVAANANPSREPCGRKLSKRVLTEAGTATRPLFCHIYLVLPTNDDQRARHSRVAVTGQIANKFIFSGGLIPLFMRPIHAPLPFAGLVDALAFLRRLSRHATS